MHPAPPRAAPAEAPGKGCCALRAHCAAPRWCPTTLLTLSLRLGAVPPGPMSGHVSVMLTLTGGTAAQPFASSMAHLVFLCPPWQPTNIIPMDVAAPSPDAWTICSLVCAMLPAMTFPAFLQFVCVLLG